MPLNEGLVRIATSYNTDSKIEVRRVSTADVACEPRRIPSHRLLFGWREAPTENTSAFRGTQRQFSVKYLFGEAKIA